MEGIAVSTKCIDRNANLYALSVSGYIDTSTSAELEKELKALLQDGHFNIIVDLSDVAYVSSAGWGIFISVIREIREKGGDLKLVGMVPDVYEVFELLEFQNILGAFPTLEEAAAASTTQTS